MRNFLADYQWVQLQQSALCLLVVGVGALVAVGAAITFVLSFFAAGAEHQERLQTVAKVFRELPVVATVSYVCLMQARKYRGARNRERLRRWFYRAPGVIVTAWVLYLLLGLTS